MDLSKSVVVIIAVFVGILITATILVPVVSNYTDESKTVINSGIPYEAVDDNTHTLTFNAGVITVDGVVIDTTLAPAGVTNYTVVYAERGFIRYDTTNVMYSCNAPEGSSAIIAQFNCTVNTVTVEITGDTAVISSSDESVTPRTIDDVLYFISSKGDYVLATSPYVLSDTQMIAGGITVITTPVFSNIYLVWSGTVEDVEALVLASGANFTSVSVVDTAVNTSSIATNLLKVSSVVITVSGTANGSVEEVDLTYTYFLAPKTITYDNPDYLEDGTYSALLMVIPVLLFVACALIAIRGISGRSD